MRRPAAQFWKDPRIRPLLGELSVLLMDARLVADKAQRVQSKNSPNHDYREPSRRLNFGAKDDILVRS